MNRKLIAVLIANLFLSPFAYAEVEGSIGVTGYLSNDDAEDKAKINEYQDVDSGAALDFGLRVRDGRYWMDGYGENIGRDDLYVTFRGGLLGTLRYDLYANWIPHNFTFGARTPYNGIGSANLVAPSFINTHTSLTTVAQTRGDISAWNRFDIGYDRREYGGSIEWQALSPWFIRGAASQFTFEGIKVMAPSNGTSPGNGFVELPLPVDYTTTNWLVEGGYNTRRVMFSAQALWSKFENENQRVNWTNPLWNGIDVYTQPADNDYLKFSVNGALRGLPWSSTLAARYTYATQESDFDILRSMLNGQAGVAPFSGVFSDTFPSSPRFEGKEKTQTFSVSWAVAPTRALDGKVYYNFYDRKNESSHITFASTALTPAQLPSGLGCGTETQQVGVALANVPLPCTTEFYDVRKHNAGIEAAWRFGRGMRISGGYDYFRKEQERADYDEVTEHRIFAEFKVGFDLGSARVKYQYATRDSNFLESHAGIDANDPLYLQRFVQKYDSSKRDQNMIKVALDVSPANNVDLGAEFIWKHNDYEDTFLGRNEDRRHELYLNAGFGDPKGLRFNVFGDVERVTYDATHRAIGTVASGPVPPAGFCTPAAPNCFDPNIPASTVITNPATGAFAQNFNWSSFTRDSNYQFGVGLTWPAMARLTVMASALYAKTRGGADFVSQGNYGVPLPITAYDNSERSTLNLKGIYAFSRQLELTAGYAWEKFDYSDFAFDNYQLLNPPPPNPVGPSTSYLTGYLAYPDYRAGILYLIGRYKF